VSARPGVVDLVIAGGTAVLPEGPSRMGIAVHHGTIAAIGPEEELPEAGRVLDAGGAVVLPGAVDVHMHYDQDGRVVDRLTAASRSAAFGGVTSMVAFLLSQPGRDYTDTLADAVTEIQRDSHTDVGFHMYLRANDTEALAAIPALVRSGVAGFKMAMAYKSRGMMCTDEFLLAAMKTIAAAGGAAMVHAECGEAIDFLEQSAIASGLRAPTDYARTRPAYAEAEAIARAATFAQATGCPLYIVHLTSAAALHQLTIAQDLGCDVLAETCPQGLLLTDQAMASQGNLAKIAPPLRGLTDVQALWQALDSGVLPVVASDHAPYPSGKKLAEPDDVFSSPFGAPVVETMLPALHSEGVVRRAERA
jgi:dihydroorotase-like cyclic amidohydrolase